MKKYCKECGGQLEISAEWTGKYDEDTGEKIYRPKVNRCPNRKYLFDGHSLSYYLEPATTSALHKNGIAVPG